MNKYLLAARYLQSTVLLCQDNLLNKHLLSIRLVLAVVLLAVGLVTVAAKQQ